MRAIRHHENDGVNGENRGDEQRQQREDDYQDKDGRDGTWMIAIASRLARRQEQRQEAIARMRTTEEQNKDGCEGAP